MSYPYPDLMSLGVTATVGSPDQVAVSVESPLPHLRLRTAWADVSIHATYLGDDAGRAAIFRAISERAAEIAREYEARALSAAPAEQAVAA